MPTMKILTTSQLQRYQSILSEGTALSTRRAYRRDTRAFFAWLNSSYNQVEHYPVSEDLVVAFILDKLPDLRINTLRRYLASLSVAHQSRGLPSPTQTPRVKLLLRRACATQTDHVSRKKAAITREILEDLLVSCDQDLHGIRDRALLLVGFASGGRRRNELSKLRVEHLKIIEGGYQVLLPSSKTDQQGHGHTVALLGEPALALRTWLVRAGVRQGYVFRGIKRNGQLTPSLSGRAISNVVKRRIQNAGYNQALFSAHSLRSGFLTEACRQGVSLLEAMELSGHKTPAVAQSYYRSGELLRNRALSLIPDSCPPKS